VDKAGNIAIRPVLPNAVLLVRYQPSLAGRLGLDERTATPTWIVPPPWGQGGPPRPVKDADATEASLWLSAAESVVLSHEHLMRAIIAEAERRPYDRFRDYLDAIEWDGSARLSMWLVDHLGAEDSEYTRSVARAWVISAVARVYQPGCQADHVLVLEGPQGCGKTSSLRALAGDEWYAEISLAATRDGVMDLHGPVVCEWAELAGMGRTEMESVKAIISRRVDRLRLPYARLVVDLPRRGILAASTNEAEWATDQSGNRRFWPVRVNDCDPAKVAVVRDQLWAEAVHAYRCGEHWWLGAEATEQAREQQAERLTQDPWLSEIAAAIKGSLAGRKSLQIADVLDAIQVPAAAQTTYAARRAGTCLRALGYVPGYAHDDETGGRRTQRVWVARISSVPESEIRAASVPGSRSTLRLL
jgi:predicted P-loop ATPase